ncbi:MAG: FtsQ-type POTRA domain-containing protein [Minisyncoccales bacterium]|jgi:cell division protein FtsQ
MVKKSYRKSYKKKVVKPVYKKRWFWFLILIIIFILSLLYLIIFSPLFEVKEILILGNEKISSEEILEVATKEINSTIFSFDSKSIFFISSKRLSDSLTKEFPKIGNLEIKRLIPNSIEIEVKERKPIAVWCNKECFFLDKEGVIFETAERPFGFVVIQEEKEALISDNVLSEKYLSFVLEFWKDVKDLVEIIGFRIVKLNIEVITKDNYFIKTITEESASLQAQKLRLAFQEKIPAEKRALLDYIDLRFEDRVYFKYR